MQKYQILYNKIKDDILNQRYLYKEKIPSIRQMINTTGYSKTTVETAYLQLLAEGYIQSINKSGYYVDVDMSLASQKLIKIDNKENEQKETYRYDFSGRSVDPKSFDLNIWQKYLKKVIKEENELYAYGNLQGEFCLRQCLCNYSKIERGVESHPKQVFIGSGFQSLLHIICGLIENLKTVAMPISGFNYAKQVFEDYHIKIEWIAEDDDGIIVEQLKNKEIQLIYINSSSSGKYSKPLPISRRMEIIEYAKKNNILIIEDDHNGELRYQVRPIPAMQSQATDYIIYIGSFSKLLIPSIRLSYMVMPDKILNSYLEKKQFYHQSVSKFEQLALYEYIEDGALNRQLKKLRRLYLQKSKEMLEGIQKYLDYEYYILEETALRVRVKLKNQINLISLKEYLKNNDININILNNEIILSFSSIASQDIEKGIQQISLLIKNKEN